MTIFQAIILGLVQGITEFLPVSSSGHLILIPSLFAWPVQDVTFDAAIHLAALSAIVFALRGDVGRMTRGLIRGNVYGRLAKLILLVTIPVLAIGYVFRDVIDGPLRSPQVVAAMMAIWGVLLFVADRSLRSKPVRDIASLTKKQIILVGLSEILALIPGTSRSGATMTVGIFSGLDRATAARFSFLLGVPAIAVAGGYALLQTLNGPASVSFVPLIFGFLSAFFAGFLSIRFLLRFLRQGSFAPFAIYRLIVAALVWFLV